MVSKRHVLGLENLNKKIPNLFDARTTDYQFAPGLGYQAQIRDAGGSVIVTDIESAKTAIQYIVDQGEGFDDGDEFADPDQLEKAHYYAFKDLLEQINTDPKAWEIYPVRSNPKTIDYYDEDRKIYHVCSFDSLVLFVVSQLSFRSRLRSTLHTASCYKPSRSSGLLENLTIVTNLSSGTCSVS